MKTDYTKLFFYALVIGTVFTALVLIVWWHG